MKLKPLGENVVVKQAEAEEQTKSGLIIPDTAKEKPQKGTVIAVGEGKFEDGKRVAAVVRETLDEIGYVGWPKTSGNRGIHVAVRIEPNWEFPVVRRCALAFAREIGTARWSFFRLPASGGGVKSASYGRCGSQRTP